MILKFKNIAQLSRKWYTYYSRYMFFSVYNIYIIHIHRSFLYTSVKFSMFLYRSPACIWYMSVSVYIMYVHIVNILNLMYMMLRYFCIYILRYIFKTINKWKYISCLQNWRLNTLKILILPKSMYKFNEI